MEQTTQAAIEYAFPNCEGLFAFDNASNYSAFAPDALVVSKMNLMPGGKQPLLRDGWDYNRNICQPMVFPRDYLDVFLQGKAKGIQQVLYERGLWRNRSPDGSKFLLVCPKTYDRPGCDPALMGYAVQRHFFSHRGTFKSRRDGYRKR